MNSMQILRELKSLDELEKRVRSVKSPSEVLLRAIATKRDELLDVRESVKPEVRK